MELTMKTKIDNILEYSRIKAQVERDALAHITKNMDQIHTLLEEIEEIVEATGVVCDIREISRTVGNISEQHPDWSSSSYNCL
jgi:predicted RNase H-like nuclease (RuvC/YqgF family)